MIDWIDEAFKGPAWHGPALMPTLRGVDSHRALWRPRSGRHNIAEIVVHAAYWKHMVRQRIDGDREGFPLRGSNWFVRTNAAEWRDDVELLVDMHDRLRSTVRRMGKRDARRIVQAHQTAAQNVRGIAFHDVYHAGQIQVLKRLADKRT